MSTQHVLSRGISALLNPSSIVVLGVSASRTAGGNEAIRNLRAAKYNGEITVVHPTASDVEGCQTFPSVAALPTVPDIALVSLPASAVLTSLLELEALGCRAALVPGAGFTREQRDDIAEFAAGSAMAVHGPNCMGILSVSDGIPLWFYEGMLTDLPSGPLALVSQSGSATFLTRAIEGVGFSRVISTGNEDGLTTADYLHWLSTDPATTAVGAVIESIRDIPRFVEAVTALRTAGKPLVVLKVGRTALGMRASTAHTGALIGRDEAYEALFRRLDVPVVSDYDELSAVLTCFGAPEPLLAAGVGVGIVTDSGGEAVLAADLATDKRVTIPELGPLTVARLVDVLPGTAPQNPVDAGGSPLAGDDCYIDVLDLVAGDPAVDTVMLIVESLATLNPAELAYSEDMFFALTKAAAAGHGKPILVASPTSVNTHDEIRRRVGPSIPVLRGLGNALVAARALAGNQRPVPPTGARPDDLPPFADVEAMRADLLAGGSGPVPAELTQRLLGMYGLGWVASGLVETAEQASVWADGRYPVAVKVSSTSVAHRSDIGGVVLDIQGPDELRAACRAIEANVTAAGHSFDGFEVQEFVSGGHEALVGFISDPVFGGVVTAGSGGVLVELNRDASVGLAPLTSYEAIDMLAGTKLSELLAGYRNLFPATDVTELVRTIVRVSWIAHDFAGVLTECDLNPVMVAAPSGVCRLVDALLVVADNPKSTSERASHE